MLNYLKKLRIPKKYKSIDGIMLAVFFIMLWIPMGNISDKGIDLQENRTLATKPKLLMENNTLNYNLGEQFDKWFNDRFFGRRYLLALHNKINQLHNNGSKKVIVGKDGWLFYRLNNGINNFANRTTLRKEKMEQGLKYLVSLNNWCKEHGKEFYYVIIPDKNKIYGEYFANIKKERSDEYSIGHQFVNYIKENSDIKVLYLYDTLMANKDKGYLYYKQNTHWTELGAYYGYKAIMEMMGRSVKEYEFTNKQNIGDLYNLFPINKDESFYKSTKLETNCMANMDRTEIWCLNMQEKDRIAFFGDSFIEGLLPFLNDNFNQVRSFYYSYYPYFPFTDAYVELIKDYADIIVLENVERKIPVILKLHFPENVTN